MCIRDRCRDSYAQRIARTYFGNYIRICVKTILSHLFKMPEPDGVAVSGAGGPDSRICRAVQTRKIRRDAPRESNGSSERRHKVSPCFHQGFYPPVFPYRLPQTPTSYHAFGLSKRDLWHLSAPISIYGERTKPCCSSLSTCLNVVSILSFRILSISRLEYSSLSTCAPLTCCCTNFFLNSISAFLFTADWILFMLTPEYLVFPVCLPQRLPYQESLLSGALGRCLSLLPRQTRLPSPRSGSNVAFFLSASA